VERCTVLVKSAIVRSALRVCSEVMRPGMSVVMNSTLTFRASAIALPMSMS
jgi:hypothetical protein